jgi:hypothetical protein
MDMVTGWTGRTACALQSALRLSNEAFAATLGVGVRTVATWHAKPELRPRPEIQQALDTKLTQADESARARFAVLIGETTDAGSTPTENSATAAAELRLEADPNIGQALERLDQAAGWEPGTARRQVASRLGQLDRRALEDRANRHRRIDQRRIAEALDEYYEASRSGYGRYAARADSGGAVITSVLTHPDWLDLECPLDAAHDRITLAGMAAGYDLSFDADAAGAAARRLAETLVTGTRLVDMPLYRLLGIDAGRGRIAATMGVTHFAEYALTMDLLEGELLDALSTGTPLRPGSLPLRDRYLPDVASVLGVGDRLCAGGALALCAIARPASPHRGPADYVLLIQERSSDVVNVARRLTVLPKGFHQPMTDYAADARIGATLRREMEEELFGREEIDNTIGIQSTVDPMHPSLLSKPMRWLMDEPDRLRMECTGFGLNLVSGNYEFASLIVISDEDFWSRYGGLIAANWESLSLRQYSSMDAESLAWLIRDTAWSNEGLFAMLQGLRRLAAIGGDRTNLPTIEWEIR